MVQVLKDPAEIKFKSRIWYDPLNARSENGGWMRLVTLRSRDGFAVLSQSG